MNKFTLLQVIIIISILFYLPYIVLEILFYEEIDFFLNKNLSIYNV